MNIDVLQQLLMDLLLTLKTILWNHPLIAAIALMGVSCLSFWYSRHRPISTLPLDPKSQSTVIVESHKWRNPEPVRAWCGFSGLTGSVGLLLLSARLDPSHRLWGLSLSLLGAVSLYAIGTSFWETIQGLRKRLRYSRNSFERWLIRIYMVGVLGVAAAAVVALAVTGFVLIQFHNSLQGVAASESLLLAGSVLVTFTVTTATPRLLTPRFPHRDKPVCRICKTSMVAIPTSQLNSALTAAEQKAQTLGKSEFYGWRCPTCFPNSTESFHLRSYLIKSPPFVPCPECNQWTMILDTRYRGSKKITIQDCLACGYHNRQEKETPPVRPKSAKSRRRRGRRGHSGVADGGYSSGSWGGGSGGDYSGGGDFGGGDSGGGGAGGDY